MSQDTQSGHGISKDDNLYDQIARLPYLHRLALIAWAIRITPAKREIWMRMTGRKPRL